MKKYLLTLALILTITFVSIPPVKAVSEHILISEVAMGSSQSASDEFVELYNNSSSAVDISGWKLEYKSATGTHWQTKAVLASGESIDGHGFYIFRTSDNTLTSGLAQTGGNLRLVAGSGAVLDALAWGNGDSGEATAASACAQEQSLSRSFNEPAQSFIDTDDNQNDFAAASQSAGTIKTEDTLADNQNDSATGEVPSAYSSSAHLEISELLPDPVSPLSDSADEFIELYNPSGSVVSLAGWVLRDSSGHSFSFKNEVIAAHTYVVVYSKQSKMSLNNDGDVIELINPSGEVVYSSPNYGSSRVGMSWGNTEDGWGWNASTTPGAGNSGLSSEQSEGSTAATTSKAKKASIKKVTVKKAAKPKVAKAKLAKAKAKAKLAGAKLAPTAATSQAKSSQAIWTWLLIVLGIGTIGYGIYEYRPEISSIINQLKSKFGAGRKTR